MYRVTWIEQAPLTGAPVLRTVTTPTLEAALTVRGCIPRSRLWDKSGHLWA